MRVAKKDAAHGRDLSAGPHAGAGPHVGAESHAGAEPEGRWLHGLRDPWPRAVCRLLEDGELAVVRVLIAEVRGSAPREPGTCMLVTRSETYGTIGGGNLEWQAMGAAQALLAAGPATRSVQVRRLVLGRELGQCCGGVVQLWVERFTHQDLPLLRQAARVWTIDTGTHADSGGTAAHTESGGTAVRAESGGTAAHADSASAAAHGDSVCLAHSGSNAAVAAILTQVSGEGVVRRLLRREPTNARVEFSSISDEQATLLESSKRRRPALWLYGAGHVAQALIHIVAELPFEVTWVDSRAALLPAPPTDNVHSLCTQTPVDTVSLAPTGTRFLVMTHDHALDYDLCRGILERGDFAWLGLIGSKSKGARFRSRLARDGVVPEAIARLTCPIGIDGVTTSKLPAAIAVTVAAQLLRGLEAGRSGAVVTSGAAVTPGAASTSGDPCASPDCTACSSARQAHRKLVTP